MKKKENYFLDELICPFTGLSVDERINDVCQYNCTMKSKCPLNYDARDQDFDDDDD